MTSERKKFHILIDLLELDAYTYYYMTSKLVCLSFTI